MMIQHSKPTLSEKELNSIIKVFNGGIIATDGIVKEFKKFFSNFIEKEYIFLYSSGYYDNEKKSWISSYKEIKKYITSQTKLILINHTFGIKFKYKDIHKLSQLNIPLNIPLIEDNAHFISNEKRDIEISNFFVASFYSFHATKLLTTGEGDAIATNNKHLANELEKNRLDNGISDINAAVGLIQIKRYNEFLYKRMEIANIYLSKIKNTKRLDSIYFRFPILTDQVEKFLNSNRVKFKKGVDSILKVLPNVLEIYNKTVSIPIYPSLSKKEVEIIIDETNKIIEAGK